MEFEKSKHSNRSAGDLPRALDHRRHLNERLIRAESLLVCLDFDGTLAPIVDEPTLAMLPVEMRRDIERTGGTG